MAWLKAIPALLGFLSEPIKRWQETKREQHQAKIARIRAGDDNAAELDKLSMASRGWKDEYLLLVTTWPIVASFIPPLVPYVAAGFEALKTMPEYYWYILAGIYIDTFGFRRMLRVAVERWLENKFGPVAQTPKRASSVPELSGD